ncbi:hypothetical protein D3C85_1454730 [compost metagenome]
MQVGAQAEGPVGIIQRRTQALGQFALLRQQRQLIGQFHRGLQGQRVVAVQVTGENDPQQTRTGIAALAVTPEPVQVLHYP